MKEFDDFINIVKKLRKECPWDKEQTHRSLQRCLLEESYEVLEAIDNNDPIELKKELGDLLLQVIFHSVMAEETKSFKLKDVIKSESKKLITRHPHIFGKVKVKNSDEVKFNWEKFKAKEGRKSILDGIPKELPALFRAYRIQEKASKVGFDWKDPEPAFEKIFEELDELKQELHKLKTKSNRDKIEDEFGDVLFALVNYSRFLKINPEDALRRTIEKFIFRFGKIEDFAKNIGKDIGDMTLGEMDKIWNSVKKNHKIRKLKKDKSYGIIIYRKERNNILYLLVKHRKGHWAFSKGHCEKGETKLESALRELHEETGIRNPTLLSNKTFIKENYIITNNFPNIDKTIEFFIGKTKKVNIKIDNVEIVDYKWLDYNKALKQITFEAAKNTLEKVNKFLNDE